MIKKSWKKLKYLENEKEPLRWNKKHFSSFFKGFQLGKQQIFFFERWGSDDFF